jgi:hypothetical protein
MKLNLILDAPVILGILLMKLFLFWMLAADSRQSYEDSPANCIGVPQTGG